MRGRRADIDPDAGEMRVRPCSVTVIVAVMLMREHKSNRNQSRADALGLRLVDLHEKIRDRDFLLQQSLFAGVSYNGVQHFLIALNAVLPWIRTHDRSLFLPDLAIPGKVRVGRIRVVF